MEVGRTFDMKTLPLTVVVLLLAASGSDGAGERLIDAGTVIDAPFGRRPLRVQVDPRDDGASVGFTVLDRLRAELLHRVGLSDLLTPRASE